MSRRQMLEGLAFGLILLGLASLIPYSKGTGVSCMSNLISPNGAHAAQMATYEATTPQRGLPLAFYSGSVSSKCQALDDQPIPTAHQKPQFKPVSLATDLVFWLVVGFAATWAHTKLRRPHGKISNEKDQA